MNDISSNGGTDDLSSSDVLVNQSNLKSNNSINSTLSTISNRFDIQNEMMRTIFIAIVIITVLICLIICVSICIRIYRIRRRKPRHQKDNDQLSFEQSTQPLVRLKSKTTAKNPTKTNDKQRSTVQQTIFDSAQPVTKPSYYANLDDIPFIDESRPTSVIEII